MISPFWINEIDLKRGQCILFNCQILLNSDNNKPLQKVEFKRRLNYISFHHHVK